MDRVLGAVLIRTHLCILFALVSNHVALGLISHFAHIGLVFICLLWSCGILFPSFDVGDQVRVFQWLLGPLSISVFQRTLKKPSLAKHVGSRHYSTSFCLMYSNWTNYEHVHFMNYYVFTMYQLNFVIFIILMDFVFGTAIIPWSIYPTEDIHCLQLSHDLLLLVIAITWYWQRAGIVISHRHSRWQIAPLRSAVATQETRFGRTSYDIHAEQWKSCPAVNLLYIIVVAIMQIIFFFT